MRTTTCDLKTLWLDKLIQRELSSNPRPPSNISLRLYGTNSRRIHLFIIKLQRKVMILIYWRQNQVHVAIGAQIMFSHHHLHVSSRAMMNIESDQTHWIFLLKHYILSKDIVVEAFCNKKCLQCNMYTMMNSQIFNQKNFWVLLTSSFVMFTFLNNYLYILLCKKYTVSCSSISNTPSAETTYCSFSIIPLLLLKTSKKYSL